MSAARPSWPCWRRRSRPARRRSRSVPASSKRRRPGSPSASRRRCSQSRGSLVAHREQEAALARREELLTRHEAEAAAVIPVPVAPDLRAEQERLAAKTRTLEESERLLAASRAEVAARETTVARQEEAAVLERAALDERTAAVAEGEQQRRRGRAKGCGARRPGDCCWRRASRSSPSRCRRSRGASASLPACARSSRPSAAAWPLGRGGCQRRSGARLSGRPGRPRSSVSARACARSHASAPGEPSAPSGNACVDRRHHRKGHDLLGSSPW